MGCFFFNVSENLRALRFQLFRDKKMIKIYMELKSFPSKGQETVNVSFQFSLQIDKWGQAS